MQYREEIIDNVICKFPIAENEIEKKTLDIKYNIFCSFMADMIIKYVPELEMGDSYIKQV